MFEIFYSKHFFSKDCVRNLQQDAPEALSLEGADNNMYLKLWG
jgi:hypothetical protein